MLSDEQKAKLIQSKIEREAYITIFQLGIADKLNDEVLDRACGLVKKAMKFVRHLGMALHSIDIENTKPLELDVKINTDHGWIHYTLRDVGDEFVIDENWKHVWSRYTSKL